MTRLSPVYVAVLACLLAVPARGQESPPAPPPQDEALTTDVVEVRIADLEASQDDPSFSDEDRTRLQLYRGALEALHAAEESRRLSSQFKEQAAQAPVELEAVRAELARPPEDLQPQPPPDATLADLEEALRSARSDLAAAEARQRELETQLTGRDTRIDEIRDQVAAAQQDLEEVAAAEATLPLPDEPPALTLARRTKLRADHMALDARIGLLQAERANYDARAELAPLRRERWVRRVGQLTKLEAAWLTLVENARAEDIRRTQEEATRAAALAHPLVAPIAESNVELARRRDELRPKLRQAQEEIVSFTPDPSVLSRELDRLRAKVQAVGMTPTVGMLLRKTRSELPDLGLRRAAIRQRRARLADAEFERLELEDEREALIANQESMIQDRLALIGPTVPAAERSAIETQLREQYRVRREYLDRLIEDLSSYFRRLELLNKDDQEVVDATVALNDFISQRILWIQSAPPFGLSDLRETGRAVAWLFGPSDWRRILVGLGSALRRDWPRALTAAFVLVALILLRRRLGWRIRVIGERLAAPEDATLGQTLIVAFFTLVRAAVLPALLWIAGSWILLSDPGDEIELAEAVGDALRLSIEFAFVLMLAYETCLPRGLGEAHFGWRPRNVRVARRQIGLLTAIILGFGIPVSIVNHEASHVYEASLGRLSFILAVLGLAYCVHGLLNPWRGILRDYLRRNPGGWVNRLRWLWYPAAVLTPLTIAVASFIGYHYTALMICVEVLNSAGYLVLIILAYYLALHWIYAGRRKLAIEQARQKQKAYEERAARGETAGEAPPPPVEMARVDVAAVSAQAVKLLRGAVLFAVLIGLFAIWSDTMPAVGFLKRVELWPGANVAEVVTTGENAETGTPTTETVYEMVTLEDVLWALVLLVVTIIVAKNIPGLLEITVLQHLPLERGMQFAISTIVRYTITIVGVVVAFRLIGVTWMKVQWLAAALTVGLGFGLNEIFGNFIAGLIILFERPIRVGDTVTVGNITGTISQIRIRATTLRDWDRKELVIPNKTFVIDTITNWTLSDPILRLVYPVTIEHEADADLAEKLLLQVAREHPVVLEDPAPSVMFKKVGEQGLEMDLRLFIPHIEHLVRARHEVHGAIVKAFRAHGVRFFAFSHRQIRVEPAAGDVSDEAHGGTT